jgi:hypothetical protein
MYAPFPGDEHMKLEELFLDTLKDIYFAERQILKALPKMTKAAQEPKLKEGFTALVHIRDEAQDDPSPETLCDNAEATNGIRATCRKHPI